MKRIPRVLLVDDDPHFLELLELELGDFNVAIEQACSGVDALKQIEKARPDVVVSDIQMPGMSGSELQQRAHRLAGCSDLPFLFVTGRLRRFDDGGSGQFLLPKLAGCEAIAERVDSLLRGALENLERDDGVAEGRGVSRFHLVESAKRRVKWLMRSKGYPVAKRVFDVILSASALAVLSPLFLLVAIAIKVEDHGPIFFVQPRIGKGGRSFPFYKFRSMFVDAEERRKQLTDHSDDGDDVRFKMRRDPRVTRVGRVLRRLSLDELPQLWNVLRGDMAVVGPRPPIREEVAKYGSEEWRRLEVEPGLTCSWQVSGRADIPFPDQVKLDLDYIQARSLAQDLKLILRTVPAVLTGRGAY